MFACTDIPDRAYSFYTADRERRDTWLRLRADWLVRIASSNRSSEEAATRGSRSQGTCRTCMRSSPSGQEVANLPRWAHPWGAMLALAYAAAHPASTGPLILVGCGTFDLAARAELQNTIAERMIEKIRARLKCADQLDQDERMKVSAEAEMSIYSYDVRAAAHEENKVDVDARAHHETWNDMVRLQTESVYPAAFAAIKVPVLMIHGTFDPHPGRLIFAGLRPYLPQLEYLELERCGHYPWLERAAADAFFTLVREWLADNLDATGR
jgi:hypothetical protein